MTQTTRDRSLDYMKGILVILMTFAHCIQFFGDEGIPIQGFFSRYINLTTFSGFLFTFGFVSYQAYFKKNFSDVWKRQLLNFGKTLLAFYLSSFAYRIFIGQMLAVPKQINEVLFVRVLVGWSEFLISFSAVTLLAMLLFFFMKRMNAILLIVFCAVSLAACFFPYHLINDGLLSVFIGSTNFISFPVIQYFFYFVLGVFFSKYGIRFHWIALVVSALASAPCIIHWITSGDLPQRFPPDILFILGATFFVYLYYLLSSFLSHVSEKVSFLRWPLHWLGMVGSNSLLFLIMGNLLIFTLRSSSFYFASNWYPLWLCIGVLAIISYLVSLVRKTRRSESPQDGVNIQQKEN